MTTCYRGKKPEQSQRELHLIAQAFQISALGATIEEPRICKKLCPWLFCGNETDNALGRDKREQCGRLPNQGGEGPAP